MLLNSTSLRVEDAFALITEYGGLGICAHVDRLHSASSDNWDLYRSIYLWQQWKFRENFSG